MATKLSAFAPRWAQNGRAFAAQARGEDGTSELQTSSGGVPGRIRGISASQQMSSMAAYRARTSLGRRAPRVDPVTALPVSPPQHGEVRSDSAGNAWQYDARTGRGAKLQVAAPAAPKGYASTNSDTASPSVAPATAAKPAPVPATPPTPVVLPSSTTTPSLLRTRQRGYDDSLKLVKPKPTRENSPALRSALDAATEAEKTYTPSSEPDPRRPTKLEPKVTVTEAPRPKLPETYEEGRQRVKDAFHVKQAADNAALVASYRAGDEAFASNSTPAQKAQVDRGMNKIYAATSQMKKNRRSA